MKLTDKQEQWLQALESGKYPQCKRVLHDGTGYCCLGVAELVCFSRPFIRPNHVALGENFQVTDGDDVEDTAMLNKDWEDLGLLDEYGSLSRVFADEFFAAIRKAGYGGDEGCGLSSYNDMGATFAQIAAAIRANPQAVFRGNLE